MTHSLSRIFFFILFLLLIGNVSNQLEAQKFSLEDVEFSENNSTLSLASAGGFNTPQFNSIDLNNDGRMDIVIYDRDVDFIRCFLKTNEDGPDAYIHAPEYESLFPPIDHFLLIRDFNKDGIGDLFVGNFDFGIAGLLVYRGRREDGVLSFEKYITSDESDNLIDYRSNSGIFTEINITVIDIPAIDDVDGDGDLDILNFGIGAGTVNWFENLANDKGLGPDTLDYDFNTFCWGGFYENDTSEKIKLAEEQGGCASFFDGESPAELRHSGSTLTTFDRNNDGLIDILIGDLTNQNIVYLENGGTQEEAWMVDQDNEFPSEDTPIEFPQFLATFLEDFNNDGKKDLVAAPNAFNASINSDNVRYYENVGTGDSYEFNLLANSLFTKDFLDVSANSVPAIADVNGDGLLDIVVGTYGNLSNGNRTPSLYLFVNNGTPEQPSYKLEDDDWLELDRFFETDYAFAPAFGDMNGDDALDLIVGFYEGGVHYFENLSEVGETMDFDIPVLNYMDIDVGYFSVPQIVDLNGDGAPDLLIGEQNGNSKDGELCGTVNMFINLGTSNQPDFNSDVEVAPNSACWGGIETREQFEVKFFSSPFVIKNGDRWHALTGSNSGRIQAYRDIDPVGEDFELTELRFGDLHPGRVSHPRLANLDTDDNYELIIGHRGGGVMIYETDWLVDGTIPVDEVSDTEFRIFPNPSSQKITIDYSMENIEKLNILSINGKYIRSLSMNSDKIDISYLQPGVYIIQLVTENGPYNQKFIKQ